MAGAETVFDNGLDTPADLLANAAAVVCFLKDISPVLTSDDSDLSAGGAHGLYLLLTGVENTINKVVNMM